MKDILPNLNDFSANYKFPLCFPQLSECKIFLTINFACAGSLCVKFKPAVISSNEYGNFFHPEDTIKQQDNIRTQKKVLYQIGFKLHVSV